MGRRLVTILTMVVFFIEGLGTACIFPLTQLHVDTLRPMAAATSHEVEDALSAKGEKSDLAQEIRKFLKKINPVVQSALLEGTKVNIEGRGLRPQYPFMCLAAAEVAKVLVEKRFGNLLKSVEVVLAKTRGPVLLDDAAFLDEHAWVEIKTYDGKRYYLSFLDGQFEKGFYQDKIGRRRKVIIVVKGVRVVNERFIKWYTSNGHDYVSFLNITDETIYQAHLDSLGVQEVARGAEIYKRGERYGWADKVLVHIEESLYIRPVDIRLHLDINRAIAGAA